MKNSVLSVMLDFVNHNLPDVEERSGFAMNPALLRSIGKLSEIPRPLSFVIRRIGFGEKQTLEKMFNAISDFDGTIEQENSMSKLVRQVNGLSIKETVLSRIFWEAVFRECPRAFDYRGPVVITDDWQVTVPRMQYDPDCQMFENNSLPSSFFSILCDVLKGGIRWDGEPPLPAVGKDMTVIGKLEKTFAQQLYLFRLNIRLFATQLCSNILQEETVEEWFERITVGDIFRFHKKLGRIKSQDEIINVLLAEHVGEFCSDFAEVSVCRGWTLATESDGSCSD